MPRIIEYTIVEQHLRGLGLRCVYHNSGAFAFGDDAGARSVGWIGPDDPTLRPEARPLALQAPPPYESNLCDMFIRTWRQHIRSPIWVMPASHWAYELEFGSAEWLPQALRDVGVDPELLRPLNTADAIEFSEDEPAQLALLVRRLLEMLHASDFTIALPQRPVICRLHHHKQLWWTTTDSILLKALRQSTEQRQLNRKDV